MRLSELITVLERAGRLSFKADRPDLLEEPIVGLDDQESVERYFSRLDMEWGTSLKYRLRGQKRKPVGSVPKALANMAIDYHEELEAEIQQRYDVMAQRPSLAHQTVYLPYAIIESVTNYGAYVAGEVPTMRSIWEDKVEEKRQRAIENNLGQESRFKYAYQMANFFLNQRHDLLKVRNFWQKIQDGELPDKASGWKYVRLFDSFGRQMS
ncbi:hypothetical protein ACFL0V_00280 [Nanoarchaeota archaeon]